MFPGAVSATRESMDYLLGQEGGGRALCLVVGGARESLDCHPGAVTLHLNKRKGFCKMALRHGWVVFASVSCQSFIKHAHMVLSIGTFNTLCH